MITHHPMFLAVCNIFLIVFSFMGMGATIENCLRFKDRELQALIRYWTKNNQNGSLVMAWVAIVAFTTLGVTTPIYSGLFFALIIAINTSVIIAGRKIASLDDTLDLEYEVSEGINNGRQVWYPRAIKD